jgi:hypothetical protein
MQYNARMAARVAAAEDKCHTSLAMANEACSMVLGACCANAANVPMCVRMRRASLHRFAQTTLTKEPSHYNKLGCTACSLSTSNERVACVCADTLAASCVHANSGKMAEPLGQAAVPTRAHSTTVPPSTIDASRPDSTAIPSLRSSIEELPILTAAGGVKVKRGPLQLPPHRQAPPMPPHSNCIGRNAGPSACQNLAQGRTVRQDCEPQFWDCEKHRASNSGTGVHHTSQLESEVWPKALRCAGQLNTQHVVYAPWHLVGRWDHPAVEPSSAF